jgi:ELWxxDGT repeat protein
VLVKDIRVGGGFDGSFPFDITNIEGTLYFGADDGVHGQELWRSDGTAAGTVLVQDIAPGSAASSPYYFTTAGPRMFFIAENASVGAELWTLPLAKLPPQIYIPLVQR